MNSIHSGDWHFYHDTSSAHKGMLLFYNLFYDRINFSKTAPILALAKDLQETFTSN